MPLTVELGVTELVLLLIVDDIVVLGVTEFVMLLIVVDDEIVVVGVTGLPVHFPHRKGLN